VETGEKSEARKGGLGTAG